MDAPDRTSSTGQETKTSLFRYYFFSSFTIPLEGMERVKLVTQTASIATSWQQSVMFAIAHEVARFSFGILYIVAQPFSFFANLHKNAIKKENLKKTHLFFPVVIITLATLGAQRFYVNASHLAIKGLVCGLHSAAIRSFTCERSLVSGLYLISMRDCLKSLRNEEKWRSLSTEQQKNIKERSQLIGAIACGAIAIAGTFYLRNPIQTNTLAFTLGALVQGVAIRVIVNRAEAKKGTQTEASNIMEEVKSHKPLPTPSRAKGPGNRKPPSNKTGGLSSPPPGQAPRPTT
jgi:hypothetical protein